MNKSESEPTKKISLRADQKTFNGEVTYERPEFLQATETRTPTNPQPLTPRNADPPKAQWDILASRLTLTKSPKTPHRKPQRAHRKTSQARNLDQNEIIGQLPKGNAAKNEAGDQAIILVKLFDLNWKFSQWLWKFDCTISIADTQNLFSLSYNCKGLCAQLHVNPAVQTMKFSKKEFLTAAKAHGKGSTLRILLRCQAIGYFQLEPEYRDTCPGGICGNPQLLEALHSGAESDFIISCKGQEFPVHRVVLKWVSPVFRRMIETPMVEASSNKLVITDVDSKVVQMMIDFLYKAQIDVVPDNQLVSLLYCAEKYELVALKEHCLKYMNTIVSETNVTEFLSCAIKCNAEEAIIKELVDYCKKRFLQLSQKDEFRAFVEANLGFFYEGK